MIIVQFCSRVDKASAIHKKPMRRWPLITICQRCFKEVVIPSSIYQEYLKESQQTLSMVILVFEIITLLCLSPLKLTHVIGIPIHVLHRSIRNE